MDFVCLEENFVEHIKSENECSTVHVDKNSRNLHKCGEIFISEEEVFSLLCTLCEAPFQKVDKFFVHVKSIHRDIYCIKSLDPLKYHANESQYEEIKLESSIEEISIDKHTNCLEKDILKQELLESKDISEESSDETWHNTRTAVQKKKTRKNFQQKILEDEKKTELLCNICSRYFKTKKTLRRHLEKIHNVQVSENNNSSQSQSETLIEIKFPDLENSKEDNKYDSSHSEKHLHKCKHCDHQFTEKTKLEEHETIHYQCRTCGKLFRTKTLLLRHETTHIDIREHKCHICQSAFKNKTGLYCHMIRHGEKKYSCNHCTKRFFLESQKKEHERVHTGERPFQCTFCGMCFQTGGSLNRHTRMHTGIKPYKCQNCDKTFATKANLDNHVVIHTGERPFVCTTCNATFPRKKALKNHEKIHSDYRGYVCKICGEAFKQYSTLHGHMKSHKRLFGKFEGFQS